MKLRSIASVLIVLASPGFAQVLTMGPAAQGTEIATATVTPPSNKAVDVTVNGVFKETLPANSPAKDYSIPKGGTIQVQYGQSCQSLKNNGYGNAPSEEECVEPVYE